MHLPNEVLLSILGSLEGADLKTSGLVSRSWCSCASVFLFEEIYVSSAKDNLEAFEAIAQSPLLSSCVRRLRYDATEFIDCLSKQQYIRELWRQAPFVHEPKDRVRWDTPNPDVNDWVNGMVLGRLGLPTTLRRFDNSQLILEGHRLYKKHASYQHGILKSG